MQSYRLVSRLTCLPCLVYFSGCCRYRSSALLSFFLFLVSLFLLLVLTPSRAVIFCWHSAFYFLLSTRPSYQLFLHFSLDFPLRIFSRAMIFAANLFCVH